MATPETAGTLAHAPSNESPLSLTTGQEIGIGAALIAILIAARIMSRPRERKPLDKNDLRNR